MQSVRIPKENNETAQKLIFVLGTEFYVTGQDQYDFKPHDWMVEPYNLDRR